LIIPLLLHSSLPHSSNATYAYNGLRIISFHKDGVLTGSRILFYRSFTKTNCEFKSEQELQLNLEFLDKFLPSSYLIFAKLLPHFGIDYHNPEKTGRKMDEIVKALSQNLAKFSNR
jgi:hypothetical protein